MKRAIWKTALPYGLALAAGAFALQWLEYQSAVRTLPAQGYILVIALAFTALGIWVGRQFSRERRRTPFEVNTTALEYLEITERERQVLTLLAEGHSNDEIARRLFVSTSTVKTHLASLYRKLAVSSRTQAIRKARMLKLVP